MFNLEGVNFFKYITRKACMDRLVIPLVHRWNKKGAVFPDSVILKDNNGNNWPVKLRKVENKVCFVGADWLKFVRDNRIEPESFLVLLLNDNDDDGPNVFSFVLLDARTHRETGGFLGPSHVQPSVQTSSFLPQDATPEEVLISDQSMEESDADDADADADDADAAADDDDDENEKEDIRVKEECPTEACQGNTSSASAKGNRRGRKGTQPSDVYGKEIFRSGVIPRPENPYFVFYMNPDRPNELRLPYRVVNDYKLYLPKKAKMRDPRGREWETMLALWKDGRVAYKGGGRNGALGSFFRVNHVQDGEPCVCEFKYGGAFGKDLTLDVYKVSGQV